LGKDTVDYVQRAINNSKILDSIMPFDFFIPNRWQDSDSSLNEIEIQTGFSLNYDTFMFSHRGKVCNSQNELENIMREIIFFREGFPYHRLEHNADIEFRESYPKIINWANESVLVTVEFFPNLRDDLNNQDLTKIEILYNECKKTILANRLDKTKLYPTAGAFRITSRTMSLTRIPKLPSDTKVLVTWREEKLQ